MSWPEIFIVLLLSHAVGDFLLQTQWQAEHKRGGLGSDPEARRALLAHVTTYTLAFVPALVWLADELGGAVFGVAALIAIPHLLQDDGRLVPAYMAVVKHARPADHPNVALAVDQ